jgi:hypothetical protein
MWVARLKSILIETIAIAVASVVELVLWHGYDWSLCHFAVSACKDDDASKLAWAAFGNGVSLVYVLVFWSLVYPASRLLRPKLGSVGAMGVSTLLVAVASAMLFYIPQVDGPLFSVLLRLVPYFSLPWFCGGLFYIWLLKKNGTIRPQAGI